MSTPLHFVILAAGKGTRMKSELPKVLHAVGGEPMIVRILRTASHFSPVTSTVVVGHMADKVRAALAAFPGVGTVVQEPQLGTGHALLQAQPPLAGQTGTVVLLYGDVPMLSRESIAGLLAHHQATGAAATVLTAHLPNPAGLGRIVRENGRFARIVEERDASPAEKALTEFNSGIYAFALDGLFDALRPDRHGERPGRVLPHRPARASSWPTAGASRRSPSPMPTSCAASTAAPSSRS